MSSSRDHHDNERPEPSLPASKSDWARVDAMTEEELHQNALADPDNPPLTKEQMAQARRAPNPKKIRETLGLTQREFAREFLISLGTLRDWEQGVRRPDSAARAYLWVIEQSPDAVREALDQSRIYAKATGARLAG